ncbi:MAG: hypothetical protein NDJ90_13450 [Oligoflexia bacterium]|nr:hypothetical protein [Oligoflexia bacterium]
MELDFTEEREVRLDFSQIGCDKTLSVLWSQITATDKRSGSRAYGNTLKPRVPAHPVQQSLQPRHLAGRDEFNSLILNAVRNEPRSMTEIEKNPLSFQTLHRKAEAENHQE